jgi:hypothetical protein
MMKALSRISLPILFLITFSFALQQCSDPCKETVCYNNGTCIDGACDCPAGYSGEDCSNLTRDIYLGTYNVSEECPNINTYTVNLYADSLISNGIKIANFSNLFSNPVNATVNGLIVSIPSQSPDNDGRSVSGSGSFYPPDKIIMQFTVFGANGYACSNSVWQK